MNDYKSAADALERAIALDPDDERLKKELGHDLLEAGQLDEALKVYQQLASDSPRDPSYRLWIARIYRAQHDFPAAEKALATAQLLDADNLEVRDEHVVLLESEGKIDEALTAMKALLDTLPRRGYAGRDSNARGHLVRQLAFLYREAKQYPAAIDAFREYASSTPNRPMRRRWTRRCRLWQPIGPRATWPRRSAKRRLLQRNSPTTATPVADCNWSWPKYMSRENAGMR